MRLVALAALVLLSVSPPLWAQMPMPTARPIPEGIDEPPPPGTVVLDRVGYVEAAIRIDLFEIEAAKLAIERTRDRAIAAFAERMIRDHETSAGELRALAYQGGPGAAPTLTLDTFHNTRLAALRVANDFDRQYLEKQIESDLEAGRLHGGYAGAGTDQALRGFAGRAAALTQAHLQEAEALRVTLGPPS
jgi:putative membrane protein